MAFWFSDLDQQNQSVLDWISTERGDYLQADKPSQYVTHSRVNSAKPSLVERQKLR